jgi:Ca2+-binding EF-hand superfamily protein
MDIAWQQPLERFAMISRRKTILLAFTGLISATVPALAKSKKRDPIARFDTDHDGTVDLAEAKKAASDLFAKLDADKDGTLSRKELHGRLSRKDFAAADTDKDKTLTKDEYLAVVEQRFKAADADGDGTVSAAEFKTPAGRALLRLLW